MRISFGVWSLRRRAGQVDVSQRGNWSQADLNCENALKCIEHRRKMKNNEEKMSENE